MAEKRRFHIPTASEIENSKTNTAESFRPTNIFKTYREQQKKEPEDAIKSKKQKQEVHATTSTVSQTANVSGHSNPGYRLTHASSSISKRTNISDEQPSASGLTKVSTLGFKDKNLTSVNSKGSVLVVKEKISSEKLVETSKDSDTNKQCNDKTISTDNSSNTGSVEPPKLAIPGKTNSLLVNQRQRGNPILKFVRNIPWEFGDIVPDYVMGQTTCALFLSLRYHQLNPNYIHERLKQLGRSYELRILLVQIDIKEPHHLLKDLAKVCILADCTLILAFSTEEAGRYLEAYKVYENKPPDAIMEKTDQNFMAKMTDCLTNIKSVNKTDVATLMSTFGSMKAIAEASQEDLSLCPGFGPQKAKRVFDLFKEPFLRGNKIRDKK